MAECLKKSGMFSWNELLTTDVAGAKAFYGALFGWTFTDAPMSGSNMNYTMAQVDGLMAGGLMPIPPQAPPGMPPVWGSYVTVDDVEASAAKAVELGGAICVPPTPIPGVGRFCVITDPQGAVLSLITYAA